ncbi:MAG TPA: hypothetical protein VF017_11940 [Thermoanaerobaculia bacterium]|nr:hypothetical protein [Thermoanaerobaculia bacterium]
MTHQLLLEVEMPEDLAKLRLPSGVDARLQALLDQQDRGEGLTAAERREAEGLVEISEFLSLLRLRSQRTCQGSPG